MRKSGRKPEVAMDRLPPHNIEAERGLLGCIMLSGEQVMPNCIARMGTSGEQFYDLRHRTIYCAMAAIYDEKKPIDAVLLCDNLNKSGMLEQVGLSYVITLEDAASTSALDSHYLDIVFERWLMRRMIVACTEAVGNIYEYNGEVGNIIDLTEKRIFEVGNAGNRKETAPIKELVSSAMIQIESYHERKGKPRGLPTGFEEFDLMTGGLQAADMNVIAGRPSTGKTSFAMNIAEHLTVELDIPVGVFSMEMKARALTERMIFSRARVNGKNVERGYVTQEQLSRITHASARIASSPIYIDDTKGMSIYQLRAKARRMKQRFGIMAMVVDYLQLLNAIGSKKFYEGRQQEVTEISQGIKELADELDIPIIVLSQLNRLLDREKERKPRLSDLRESGAIEQDADLVGMLYKAVNADDADAEYKPVLPVNLLIAKQRNGDTGDVNMTFFREWTRFVCAEKKSLPEPNDAQQTMAYRDPHANA